MADRPEWCPQDVWEEAVKVQYQEPGLCLANSQVEPTARAILAERERCAIVAEGFPGWMQPRDVAKAIRNGTEYHHG